jgi:arylsulfatase A-like enzyme
VLIATDPLIHAGRAAHDVRTVDIAPTLAVLLGVRRTERLDRVPVPEALPRH